jgi:hypothetical protein
MVKDGYTHEYPSLLPREFFLQIRKVAETGDLRHSRCKVAETKRLQVKLQKQRS